MSSYKPTHLISSAEAESACSFHSHNTEDASHDSYDGADTESLDDYEISFEERCPKIRKLCRQLWPDADHDKTIIEAHQQGGFNRIYPITITENETTRRYVLRMARYEYEVEATVLILKNLEQRNIQVPIPALITYDFDHHNPLKYPYIILERVSGRELQHTYPSLSQRQKVILAKKLGILYQQILAITNPISGMMVPAHEEDGTLSSEQHLQPLGINEYCIVTPDPKVEEIIGVDDLLADETLNTEPLGLSSKDTLLLAFKRRLYFSKSDNLSWEVEIAEQAIEAINQIASDGLLDDPSICVWHTDFFPRNIMVDAETNPDDPIITGVLDWDNTGFTPQFAACRPPDWLWDPNSMKENTSTKEHSSLDGDSAARGNSNTGDSDKAKSDDEPLKPIQPQTPEDLEIKQAFDLSAGEVYCSMAYDPRFIVSRSLLNYCLYVQWDDPLQKKFRTTLSHWEAIQETLHPSTRSNHEVQCNLDEDKSSDGITPAEVSDESSSKSFLARIRNSLPQVRLFRWATKQWHDLLRKFPRPTKKQNALALESGILPS